MDRESTTATRPPKSPAARTAAALGTGEPGRQVHRHDPGRARVEQLPVRPHERAGGRPGRGDLAAPRLQRLGHVGRCDVDAFEAGLTVDDDGQRYDGETGLGDERIGQVSRAVGHDSDALKEYRSCPAR